MKLITLVCLLLALVMPLNLVGCTKVQAADLMDGISSEKVTGKAVDIDFISHQSNLYFDLFKASAAKDKANGESGSLLVSPLSVILALTMTANGANGQTKQEMEAALGGEKTVDELNEYLYTYVNNLPSGEKYKLAIANSIWFRDDEERLTVEKEFLQKNANYYSADAYKAPFDGQTLKDINSWVKNNTDGMIDKILDEINESAVMYLINAITFDAEWQKTYEKSDIYNGTFTAYDGEKQDVKMMTSGESTYIHDDQTTGFIKNYKDGKYSFAALLPSEGIDIYDYIRNLDGDKFISLIQNAENAYLTANLPKFSYDYEISMNDILKDLGMPTAFEEGAADFSKLGNSSRGNIFISDVLHKTFISVDELGTRAGAVTKVEMRDESAAISEKCVTLDRPFVYAIVDNATSLPIFIGAVTEID